MLDPNGNEVYARFALMRPASQKKPVPRMLKCVYDGGRTLRYIDRLLRRILKKAKFDEDYFSANFGRGYSFETLTGDEKWEELRSSFRGRWVACYAVTGDSEGHYIHVDLVQGGGCAKPERMTLWTGKTFMGMQSAQELAGFLAILLGA